MSEDTKTLCAWKEKDITTDFNKLVKIVDSPKYICENCARVSKKKKYLCDPKPLKSG